MSRFFIVVFIIILLVAFELIGGRSYVDECLCLVAFIYVLRLYIKGFLIKRDKTAINLLIVCIVIGLISNVYSEIQRTFFSVLVDVIAETKVLWVYYAAKYYITNKVTILMAHKFIGFAKIYFLIAFICGIISQFVNIGMTESSRYGIEGFSYIFPMSFQYLAFSLVLIALMVTRIEMRYHKIYYIIAALSLMLATKSGPLLFGLLFLILSYYFYKHKTLKLSTLIALVFLVLFVGTFQIETYLTNENAPRYLFFQYGGITANRFFPFGSGFATFGSDQAARDYSPLYYEYGFDYLYGMSPEDSSFLSDTFWPTAIAQFGWIGFVSYCMIFINIFISIKRQAFLNNYQKAFLYAGYGQYIIHAVGSAILSSSAGMLGFIGLAMIMNPYAERKR